MNVREMQKGVQIQLNALDIPMNSEDVVYHLNRAQEVFIDEQYVLLRGKYTDNENLELYSNSQQAIENLRTVLQTEQISNADISSESGYQNAKSFSLLDLSEEYYYFVRSEVQVANAGQYRPAFLITQEQVKDYARTVANYPMIREYPLLIEGTKAIYFYGPKEPDVYAVNFTYIRTPDELVLNQNPQDGETYESILPKHTHQDVVDVAVRLIKETYDSRANAQQLSG